MSEISLAEYARRHGRTPDSARQMANRGGFRTARKAGGRDWMIDEHEPYPDRRRRMGEALTREGRESLDPDQRRHELRIAQAKQYSRIGCFGDTFNVNLKRIPSGLADLLTPEQLGWIVDLLYDAYTDGQRHPDYEWLAADKE